MSTYGVRVGDDGRWHLKTEDIMDARKAAWKLSTEGFLGVAQIVNFTTGARESWSNGLRKYGDAFNG